MTDPREALQTALKSGDQAQVESVLRESPALLNAYIKGIMVAPKSPDGYPEIVDLLRYINPNREISGGSIAAVTGAHMGVVPEKKSDQRLAIMFLLLHGADPNVTFTPAEMMENAQPLSLFSMLVTSEIGNPVIDATLQSLVDDLCRSKLTLEGKNGELSKIQEITVALHPANMLKKSERPNPQASEEFDGIMGMDFAFESPAFNPTQLMQSIIAFCPARHL